MQNYNILHVDFSFLNVVRDAAEKIGAVEAQMWIYRKLLN